MDFKHIEEKMNKTISVLQENFAEALVIKSNGSASYETTDLACIWERVKLFNPDEFWYLTDARQGLHFEQVFRVAYKSKMVSETTNLEFLGFGTMKYFNILKMQKALALLEQGVSVRDVGERLGFDSQSYFSTSFKRHFGYSPTHIKKGVYVIDTE